MNFKVYQSPFTWRYASSEMRELWSENNKRVLWRKMWVALAEVQSNFGLVTKEQLEDLRTHAQKVDIKRALEIESEIHHDLMAEIKTFAEQCKIGGGIIHLGATSVDIEDNTDAFRIRNALALLIEILRELLDELSKKIVTWAEYPTMGYTHIQPAEPTTLGYRFAQYGQDLLQDWEELNHLHKTVKGKGFKGAVGTGASYAELIGVENLTKFEESLSDLLDLPFFSVTTQTYPRKQEYQVISALSGIGGSLHKFAFDLRILQSPPFGELSEPFKEKQVGSSAMPFKRNPIKTEKINSLARMLAQFPRLAWDNAAHSLLERTLDDSANRRTMLPEAFLICDELLHISLNIIENLQINKSSIEKNLEIYGPFAATEKLLMALAKNGADRQDMHELIRKHTMKAWVAFQEGLPNPLIQEISKDKIILTFLKKGQILDLLNANAHIGNAPQRAVQLAKDIQEKIQAS